MCWLSNQKIGQNLFFFISSSSYLQFWILYNFSAFHILFLYSVIQILYTFLCSAHSLLSLSTHSKFSPFLYIISCCLIYFCILKSVLHLISFLLLFFFCTLQFPVLNLISIFVFCMLKFPVQHLAFFLLLFLYFVFQDFQFPNFNVYFCILQFPMSTQD